MTRARILIGVVAASAVALGGVSLAAPATAYGPSASALKCRLYFGDQGSGSSASTYNETLTLTASPAAPVPGTTVTVTVSGAVGPVNGPVAVGARVMVVRPTLDLSGAQTGSVPLASSAYPAAGVAPFTPMGSWTASGSYQAAVGTTTAALKLLKFDYIGGVNVDTYCADTVDSDIKGSGGAVSATIAEQVTTVSDWALGSYAVSSHSVWVTRTVSLTPSGVGPEVAAVNVSWGDGTVTPAVSTSLPTTHTYSKAGVFAVTTTFVHAGDGATAEKPLGSVRSTKDTVKPTATVTLPVAARRALVASWQTIRGTAADTGLGPRSVVVSLVEKRGKAFYAYTGTTWRKAASVAAARRAARQVTVPVTGGRTWSMAVRGLAKGTLTVSYRAVDKAGNASADRLLSQVLSR